MRYLDIQSWKKSEVRKSVFRSRTVKGGFRVSKLYKIAIKSARIKELNIKCKEKKTAAGEYKTKLNKRYKEEQK